MRYKLLGHSGLRVSELALGTMTFGPDWGWGAEKDECKAMFEAFAEAGATSSTPPTGTPTGRRKVRGRVRGRRPWRLVVTSTYTLSRNGADPNASGNHGKSPVESLDRSLRRLDTDYMDVYWVHIWDPLTPLAETMRALDDQVRAGKVLYLGISDAPAWVVARATTLAEERGWTPFSAVQSRYSRVDREADRELLPMSVNLDLTFMPWGALAAGLLTGKYNDDPEAGGRLTDHGWGGLESTGLPWPGR